MAAPQTSTSPSRQQTSSGAASPSRPQPTGSTPIRPLRPLAGIREQASQVLSNWLQQRIDRLENRPNRRATTISPDAAAAIVASEASIPPSTHAENAATDAVIDSVIDSIINQDVGGSASADVAVKESVSRRAQRNGVA